MMQNYRLLDIIIIFGILVCISMLIILFFNQIRLPRKLEETVFALDKVYAQVVDVLDRVHSIYFNHKKELEKVQNRHIDLLENVHSTVSRYHSISNENSNHLKTIANLQRTLAKVVKQRDKYRNIRK